MTSFKNKSFRIISRTFEIQHTLCACVRLSAIQVHKQVLKGNCLWFKVCCQYFSGVFACFLPLVWSIWILACCADTSAGNVWLCSLDHWLLPKSAPPVGQRMNYLNKTHTKTRLWGNIGWRLDFKCGYLCWLYAVPPLRTSHTPSTEKHVWLCVSSTAQGREWLDKKNRKKATQTTVQTKQIKMQQR